MSPNNETVRKGEYGVLDEVTCLDHWPTLDYFASRPGRSVLIVDDLAWNLSKKGSPSQYMGRYADSRNATTVRWHDHAPRWARPAAAAWKRRRAARDDNKKAAAPAAGVGRDTRTRLHDTLVLKYRPQV